MENESKKLKEEIDKKRKALDIAMDNDESVDTIYKIGGELDKAVANYLNYSKNINEKKMRLLGKYEDIIEKEYKNEIIAMIKEEVKDLFTNMLDEELDHFSNNVYIYSILKANDVKMEDILKQIMYRNSLFRDEMDRQGKTIKTDNPKVAEDYYIKLVDKYEKIIKERM